MVISRGKFISGSSVSTSVSVHICDFGGTGQNAAFQNLPRYVAEGKS